MTRERDIRSSYEEHLDPPRQRAIQELTALVTRRWPAASFVVSPGEDNPEATHVFATVDIEDPDEVVDVVIERMLELQIDEGIPVHLIPIRTPARVAALRQRQHPARAPMPLPRLSP